MVRVPLFLLALNGQNAQRSVLVVSRASGGAGRQLKAAGRTVGGRLAMWADAVCVAWAVGACG
jgi:hypothetical protein